MDCRHNFVRYRKKSPENSQAGAKAYEALLRGKLARGETLDRADELPAPNYAAFADHWMKVYVAANNKPSEVTKKASILSRHLLPAFGHLQLAEISSDRVEQYKADKLADGLSPKSVNNHLTILRKSLDCACEWRLLAVVPRMRWLRCTRPPIRYLQDHESVALLRAEVDRLSQSMILLALRTGMRVGELLGLRWRDVDVGQQVLTIASSIVDGVRGTPKNHRVRVVPLTADAAEGLSKLRRGRSASDTPVFSLDGHAPLSRDQANWRLHRACRTAGIPTVGWHALRHTFATDLLRKGANIRAVQSLLGHSTVLMTERYTHVAPHQLREAVSLLCTTPSSEHRGQPVGNASHPGLLRRRFAPVTEARFSAQLTEKDTASAMSPSW